MSLKEDFTYPLAVLQLSNRLFAISVKHVETMVQLPEVVDMPQSPDFVKGVIDLRGKNFMLIDLRKRLGMKSIADETKEFVARMDAAKDAHKHWLEELEASVKENRPFTLATDSHKCAFGQWYDSVTTSDLFLETLLSRINVPHQKIHALAEKVDELRRQGDMDAIDELLTDAKRTVFVDIMQHFDAVKSGFVSDRKQIAVIVKTEKQDFALEVDSVETIETFLEEDIEDFSSQLDESQRGYIPLSVGKTRDKKTAVIINDVSSLMDKTLNLSVCG